MREREYTPDDLRRLPLARGKGYTAESVDRWRSIALVCRFGYQRTRARWRGHTGRGLRGAGWC